MNLRVLANRLLEASRFSVAHTGDKRQVPHGRKSKWVPSGQYRVTLNPGGALYGEKSFLDELSASINRDFNQVLSGPLQDVQRTIESILAEGEGISPELANTLVESVARRESLADIRSMVGIKDGEHMISLRGELVITGDDALAKAEQLAKALDAVCIPVRKQAIKTAAEYLSKAMA